MVTSTADIWLLLRWGPHCLLRWTHSWCGAGQRQPWRPGPARRAAVWLGASSRVFCCLLLMRKSGNKPSWPDTKLARFKNRIYRPVLLPRGPPTNGLAMEGQGQIRTSLHNSCGHSAIILSSNWTNPKVGEEDPSETWKAPSPERETELWLPEPSSSWPPSDPHVLGGVGVCVRGGGAVCLCVPTTYVCKYIPSPPPFFSCWKKRKRNWITPHWK